MSLAPGQTRPLLFRLSAQGSLPITLPLEVTYVDCDSPNCHLTAVGYELGAVCPLSPGFKTCCRSTSLLRLVA